VKIAEGTKKGVLEFILCFDKYEPNKDVDDDKTRAFTHS